MFAVIVTLEVVPGRLDEFLDGLRRNARLSLADEPGCLRFDIHRSVDDPHRFILYELYADESAFFDAHRGTEHYAEWRIVAERCVVPGSHVNAYATPILQEDESSHA